MNTFEHLAANVQALLLAKLAMELSAEGCANLHDLARKRDLDVTGTWRRICRMAGQPVCAVPVDAVAAQ